jgi:para-aminobenzoate synthetase component 2
MIVIIDNYDSFVHNLARYIRLAGDDTKIIRNDEMSVANILDLKPSGIVISPGPCGPIDAGISVDLIRAAHKDIHILGVCLGHQCIGHAFGHKISRAKRPMHGMASHITHDDSGLFRNLPNPLLVGRYHSLIVDKGQNSVLNITAKSEDDEIMGIQHKEFPVFGVQFHPESILTECGHQLINNFLEAI